MGMAGLGLLMCASAVIVAALRTLDAALIISSTGALLVQLACCSWSKGQRQHYALVSTSCSAFALVWTACWCLLVAILTDPSPGVRAAPLVSKVSIRFDSFGLKANTLFDADHFRAIWAQQLVLCPHY